MQVGGEDVGRLAADRLRVGLVLPRGLLFGKDDAWSLHPVALFKHAGDTLCFSFCLEGCLEAIGIL